MATMIVRATSQAGREYALGNLVHRLWAESEPATDTLVQRYLEGRDITIPIPPTIRFAQSLKHSPSDECFPAMIAAVQDPDGHVCAIFRTYLCERDGLVGKAPVEKPKMALGPISGGAVRLAEAGVVLVPTEHGLNTELKPTVIIAEGVEDALTCQQEAGLPAWAALGTANLAKLILPPEIKQVIIAADGDQAGRLAALKAARIYQQQGRTVRIAHPPTGKDFNQSVINEKAAHLSWPAAS